MPRFWFTIICCFLCVLPAGTALAFWGDPRVPIIELHFKQPSGTEDLTPDSLNLPNPISLTLDFKIFSTHGGRLVSQGREVILLIDAKWDRKQPQPDLIEKGQIVRLSLTGDENYWTKFAACHGLTNRACRTSDRHWTFKLPAGEHTVQAVLVDSEGKMTETIIASQLTTINVIPAGK